MSNGNTKKKNLFLEIGVEEIPASYCAPALSQLEESVKKSFIESDIVFSKIKTYGTPRRFVLTVSEVELKRGGDVKLEKLGEILQKAVSSISFSKSMRWNVFSVRFARPVRWISALYGNEIVKFNYEGIEIGNFSYGHRFLAPEKFIITGFGQYQEELKKRFVVVDHRERREIIKKQIGELAQKAAGKIFGDEKLLDIVNWLVEYPVALSGGFKKEYLALPKELLIMVMRYHQKYFALVDEKSELLPNFITISNMKADKPQVIVEGNEKVLTARLNDAQFLYAADKKTALEKRVKNLQNVVFQEKLGTMKQKTERLVKIAEFLSSEIDSKLKKPASRAALLCKADLVSGMVGEFPELQGVMGGYYAELSGESKEVSRAIFEHYLPRFANDNLPETKVGSIVSLADKMDNLAGYFIVGLIPTGAEDPYALRRQALGVIRIIWNNDFEISLEKLIDKSLASYGKIAKNKNKAKKELVNFLAGRLENLLETKKVSANFIAGVAALGVDDLSSVKARIEALNWAKTQTDFRAFQSALKRVNNILGGKKFAKTVNQKLLKEPAENDLHKNLNGIQKGVEKALGEKKYKEALEKLMPLAQPINNFFDKVLVMDKNKKIKDNRLALIGKVYNFTSQIADFKKLNG
jgi:glycyl-tRNA synthetase beta chain